MNAYTVGDSAFRKITRAFQRKMTKGRIMQRNPESGSENKSATANRAEKHKIKITDQKNAKRYFPSPEYGLSAAQVEERTLDGLSNIDVGNTTKTIPKIILTNIFTYFNLIFFILAGILLVEGSYNNLTFLVVVFVNTIIGTIQEIRAKKTLEKLSLVSAPLTKVIRDGKEGCVGSEELVLDDIVIFEAGNQICADAVVCSGNVTVNEALVTGESDEIAKKAGAPLLSGSFVVSGRCRARLERVGRESFASKLTLDAKKIKKKQQPGMMKSLTLLIKVIGIIIIPFSVLMFINQRNVQGMPIKENIESTAASVIGMIPEGLYLLTSIALAVSVMRLAKKKTLVHDMKCIETLARVDVICVDKTGTVTEPVMHIKDIIPLDSDTPAARAECARTIRDLVLNMTADNATMRSLTEYFDDKKDFRRAYAVKSFSSETKYSAAAFRDGAYVLGAPEFLLRDGYNELQDITEAHSSVGERVLLFAEYRYAPGTPEDIFAGGSLDGIVIPMALITLENRVRPEARETFGYFARQGVAIKVISGDNPVTVSKAAREAGIPDSDKYVDATILDTKEKIYKGILEYNVFGRVTPEQKRLFILALKKAGHTVAMTGDGVNDVLALKNADCSIAMASGSDAAANVSDLVLLDSNFASMPAVVAEGRRVINNIERSASLFLVKNIFSFILTLLTLITTAVYPFKPAQLSLVSGLMIGIPSFFLALEPNTEMVKGKFLRNVLFRAFPAALTAVILVGWSLLFSAAFDIAADLRSTVAFYIYSFVAYMMLYTVCKPLNLLHKALFVSMGALFVVAVSVIPTWFNLVPLDLGAALILTALALLAFSVNRVIRSIFDNFAAWVKNVKDFIRRDIEKHRNEI